VADLVLDNQLLKETARETSEPGPQTRVVTHLFCKAVGIHFP